MRQQFAPQRNVSTPEYYSNNQGRGQGNNMGYDYDVESQRNYRGY